jgi:hypothetical protein
LSFTDQNTDVQLPACTRALHQPDRGGSGPGRCGSFPPASSCIRKGAVLVPAASAPDSRNSRRNEPAGVGWPSATAAGHRRTSSWRSGAGDRARPMRPTPAMRFLKHKNSGTISGKQDDADGAGDRGLCASSVIYARVIRLWCSLGLRCHPRDSGRSICWGAAELQCHWREFYTV